MATSRSLGVRLAAAVLAACLVAPALHAQGLALHTVEVASELVRPVGVVSAQDGTGRLFLVQQTGEILIHDGDAVLATPFLDLSASVICCGERGLLGLAFHPEYSANGLFYTGYTDGSGDTVIAEYEVSAGDPDQADPTSERVLLTVDQPLANHNGGQLAFGPDGYLYVALGDGGGGGDPEENGQDLSTLLGAILRIDPDGGDPGLEYGIPADNPFLGDGDPVGTRDEIWAYGLRNPWRFSFDRLTGDLFIGDVGQQNWEEIDFEPAGSPGGRNYGWDCREGAHPYVDPNGDQNAECPAAGFVDPVMEYLQEDGRCSVTGGFRYRGDLHPRLRGVYLFADFCTGEIFGTVPRCDGAWDFRTLLDAPFNVTSFGEDEAGEVYVTEYATDGLATSKIHRLVLAAGSGGPDLEPSPAGHDFGTVEVGDTVAVDVTLTNANLGPEALAVSSMTAADDELTIDPGGSAGACGPAPCLAPGASCTLTVLFQAASAGAFSGTLDLEGSFDPETVPISADAVPCSTQVNIELTDGETETDTVTHRACDTITAGPYTVGDNGDVTLRAGTRVVLRDGFRVAGGSLAVEVF